MHGRGRLFTITLLLLFMGGDSANASVGFQPPVTYPAGTAPVAVAIGDFNGDGHLDLAVANHGDPSAGDDGSTPCASTNLNRRSRYPLTSPLTSASVGSSLPSV